MLIKKKKKIKCSCMSFDVFLDLLIFYLSISSTLQGVVSDDDDSTASPCDDAVNDWPYDQL
jgi:hypothetical protein